MVTSSPRTGSQPVLLAGIQGFGVYRYAGSQPTGAATPASVCGEEEQTLTATLSLKGRGRSFPLP